MGRKEGGGHIRTISELLPGCQDAANWLVSLYAPGKS